MTRSTPRKHFSSLTYTIKNQLGLARLPWHGFQAESPAEDPGGFTGRETSPQNAVRPVLTSRSMLSSASRSHIFHSIKSQPRRAMTLTVTGTISSTSVTLLR